MRTLLLLASLLLASAASAQTDMTSARSGLREFQQVCAEEGTRFWGVSLCGRLLLVEPRTRLTIATFREPDGKFSERDGLFEGTLPTEIQIANTSVHWGADDWAMVMLPLPVDPFSRLRLLTHESFHRIQPGLNLNTEDVANGHLDSEDGRLWLRMEIRALSQALRLSGTSARVATEDALLFRAARRSVLPNGARAEMSLEMQEGLAEFTGTAVALARTGESVNRVARSVEAWDDQTAYARSFAYATGPVLGLLLDRYAPGWRKKIRRDTDLSTMLAAALRFRSGTSLMVQARLRAGAYGFTAVAADEHAREERRQATLAAFRARFIEGPVLLFPRTEELRRTFNPSTLVTFGDNGTVYPAGTFTSRWGRLQIDDTGGLLAPDNQSLRPPIPRNGR